MAEKVELGQLGATIQARIVDRIRKFAPDDPKLNETLLRIGLTLESQIKLNIRSQRLIDTGTLLNSIRHEIYRTGTAVGVRVGSFGVPYAAVHEYGFNGPQAVRAHTRVISQAFGRPIKPVTVQFRGFTRNMRIPARPYLAPALKKQSQSILKAIKDLLSGKS